MSVTSYEVEFRNGSYLGEWNTLSFHDKKEKALAKIDEDSITYKGREYRLTTSTTEDIMPTKVKLNPNLYKTTNTVYLVLYKTGINGEFEVADQFPSKQAAELYIKNTPLMFPIIRKVVIE